MLETSLRVASALNVGTTGLTGTEIKFRRSPFGSGDVITIAGVSGGTNGIYLCSFIGVTYQAAQLWISSVYQSTWGTKYIGDLPAYLTATYLAKAGGTMSGNIAMGGSKVTGAGAATANGDLTRWEQTGVITEARTISGQWLYTTLPSASPGNNTLPPTASGHFTPKWYVDNLFGGAIGVVQSTYLNKCIPLRAIEDAYSHTTLELCNTYLSGLTDISTRTGTMLLEPLGQATNTINADNGTSGWISDGVFIQGVGKKPIINRRAPNSSITTTGGVINCRIKDGATGTPVVAARAYTNWTFVDCEFDVPDATDVTFTGCKFLGINKFKSVSGNAVELASCTGDMFWYNDGMTAPTISGASQPADIRAVSNANFSY